MRFLILAKIPTEDGNKMVQDPKLLEKLEKYINNVKAETTSKVATALDTYLSETSALPLVSDRLN